MYQLTQALHRNRRNGRDTIATVDGRERRSWAVQVDRIARIADVLARLNIRHGDRVAVLARNSASLYEQIFATFWAGGVIVPVNTRWNNDEILEGLRDSGSRILIVGPEFADTARCLLGECCTLEQILEVGMLEEMLAAATPALDAMRCGDELAMIVYTGGTSGKPKGVMLSHANLIASALGYAGRNDCAPGVAMLHIAPMFHVGALSAVFASNLRGTRHVFLDQFDPATLMETISRERITDTFLVPTMLQMVLDHPELDQYDLSCLERIIYGASPITPALMDRAIAAWPRLGFVQAYGMTELSPVATLLSPRDHRDEGRQSGRIRSAGRATMTVEVAVFGPDDMELPSGEIGEIVARGPTVMRGYWQRPQDTEIAVRNGWMHTGDLGRMDRDGYVYVVDRLKDMIITGGENVYPVEVERALSRHPSVGSCAVIGVPDPRWGECVHAVIVPSSGSVCDPTELASYIRLQIAAYKCPRSFELRDGLPLTSVGKVLKTELRADWAARAR